MYSYNKTNTQINSSDEAFVTFVTFACKFGLFVVFVLGMMELGEESECRRRLSEFNSGDAEQLFKHATFLLGTEEKSQEVFCCKKARNGLFKWGAMALAAATPVGWGFTGGAGLVAGTKAIVGGVSALGAAVGGQTVHSFTKLGYTKYGFTFKIGKDRKLLVRLDDMRTLAKYQAPQYAEVTMIGLPDIKNKRVKLVLKNLKQTKVGRVCDRWIHYGEKVTGNNRDERRLMEILCKLYEEKCVGTLKLMMKNPHHTSKKPRFWRNRRGNTDHETLVDFEMTKKQHIKERLKDYIKGFTNTNYERLFNIREYKITTTNVQTGEVTETEEKRFEDFLPARVVRN